MSRDLVLRVTVKDEERALLTRDGRLEQVLEPGRHGEVLAAKSALDAELRAYVRERGAQTGLEVTELA